jgi:DNA primase
MLDILKNFNPKILNSGQIRIKCPFRDLHKDGSGQNSMFLSPEINSFHCFSCKSKGRLVTLLEQEFDVEHSEAVELVNTTEAYLPKKIDFEVSDSWNIEPPEAFLERGYTEQTLRHFQVGIADDGKICIPVYDHKGEMRGVVYQVRKKGRDKKVWHSPGLPKSEILYNLNYAYSYTVLSEGPTDVWRIFQNRKNTCGSLGSYLSADQASLLHPFEIVYLMYDNDWAGMEAIEAANYRLQHHVDIKIIPYMSKDPGDCLMREFMRGFNSATDYLEYSMAMADAVGNDYEQMRRRIIKQIQKEDG